MAKREPACVHPVVLYGTAPGELRPERAVCVECRKIVTVEFWAKDRAVAFAAVLVEEGWEVLRGER